MTMNAILPHPSAFIKPEDVHNIREAAPLAEQLGLLHPSQLEVIHRQKWFKLLVPEKYSGLQITLPNLVRLQEAISWADGSTGWVVTLCSGAGWFGGFIDPETAREVFSHPEVCLAGSGAVGGTAEITEKGYLINGSWKYASGAHHATHITANCAIKKDGAAVLAEDGGPLVLPFIFDKKDVTILPAWKYTGMVATGSDAFEVKNLEIAGNRQFKIDPSAAIMNAPLYRYPFLQLAEATLAVNLSGMAIHFMDLCEGIFNNRISQSRLTRTQAAYMMETLNNSKVQISGLRSDFFAAVDQSWEAIKTHHVIPEDQLIRVSSASRTLARKARQLVDELYPMCGLVAASTETDINRAWRDLHTACQHSLLTFDH